jgi:transcriptional regulator with XRE-family HTH domain
VAGVDGGYGSWPDVAEMLRAQRKMARLSLRHLASLTHVSDSYLSQVERGLYQPSPEVLKAIAEALGLSVASLYERLGWLDEDDPVEPSERQVSTVEEAIAADDRLRPTQKKALRDMYRALVGED